MKCRPVCERCCFQPITRANKQVHKIGSRLICSTANWDDCNGVCDSLKISEMNKNRPKNKGERAVTVATNKKGSYRIIMMKEVTGGRPSRSTEDDK